MCEALGSRLSKGKMLTLLMEQFFFLSSCFLILKQGSHASQGDLELAMQEEMTLNF